MNFLWATLFSRSQDFFWYRSDHLRSREISSMKALATGFRIAAFAQRARIFVMRDFFRSAFDDGALSRFPECFGNICNVSSNIFDAPAASAISHQHLRCPAE